MSRGDLVVQLDERDFLPRLQRATAQVDDLEAQIGSEKIRFENDRNSLEQERELLEIALEARLQSARAQLDEIALALERSRVVAPFDGVVAGVEVTVGDQVKQDAVLLRLYSASSHHGSCGSASSIRAVRAALHGGRNSPNPPPGRTS
ncbi:MAG: hypothetical protein WCA32_13695 [Chromatiaceae bacterium]